MRRTAERMETQPDDLFEPSLDDLIREAEREIKFRETVYPRMIDSGRLHPARAKRQIQLMRAIGDKLRELK